MKKIIAIIIITVMTLSCFTACGEDKSFPLEEGHMLMLGQIRYFSEEELNDHYVGWTRDEMIFTWGTPHSSYYGFYGDAWYHDYENGGMICARYNPDDDTVVSVKLVEGKKESNSDKPVLEKGSVLLLEQVKYFSDEELEEYFKGVKLDDIIEMWGVPASSCADLDINLYYGKDPEPVPTIAVSYTPGFYEWCYDYDNKLNIRIYIGYGLDKVCKVNSISLTSGEVQTELAIPLPQS